MMSDPESPPHALDVSVEQRDEAAIIRLAGSANMDVATDLQERLLALVEKPIPQIVIDLSDLDFINSVGLGAIVAAHLRCCHQDCHVKLAGAQPKVLEILQVTKLTSLFPMFDSVDAALSTN